MDITKITQQVAERLEVRRWVVLTFTLTQLALVLLMIIFLVRGNTHRETLVPPVIHQSFWVEDDAVSKQYFIEMGIFLAQLYFDVTPANVDFNRSVLMRYIDPRFYGKMENESGAITARIKADNASTFFSIASVVTDEKHRRVALQGTLHTYIGDNRTSYLEKIYVFEFGNMGGKILLTGMRETNNANKPFDIPAK